MAEAFLVHYRDPRGRDTYSPPEESLGSAVRTARVLELSCACEIRAIIGPDGEFDWEEFKALAEAMERTTQPTG